MVFLGLVKQAHKLALFGTAVAVCALAVVIQQPGETRKRRRVRRNTEASSAANTVPEYGIALRAGRLEIVDWNAWMRRAPTYIRASLDEGVTDPEAIVANLFRRLFPEHPWPPVDESLLATWYAMVAIVGRSLERPFKPHLEIVS